MLDITPGPGGELVFKGRLDASQVDRARTALKALGGGVLDFAGLDYISSAGLGVLLAAQKELGAKGLGLKLVNLNPYLKDVFHLSGFDQILEIC